jgi:flavin-dependent dehydrogenase
MSSAIIIGGGPAGSIAALVLARAGLHVDLFEQHLFPRDKVCGECLSGVGIDVLTRADVLSVLESAQPARLTRSLLHPMNGPEIEIPLPRNSMGISRSKMDSLLLGAAASARVTIHQPARCEAIIPQAEPGRAGPVRGDTPRLRSRGDTPRLRWRDLQTNSVYETKADWILLADGKGALLPSRRPATGDIGIKTHFTQIDGPRDAIELFAGPGHYGGLAAIDENCWDAAFSVPAYLVRQHAGDLQKVFQHVAATHPTLRHRLATAIRTTPWLAAPVPRFAVSNNWLPGIIPIGNAAAALEPVGGEGMGLALRSAELAANAIIAKQTTDNDTLLKKLPADFKKLWQVRRTICRGIAMIFSNEHLADSIAPLMAANIEIPTALMRLAGKADGSAKRW